MHISNFFFDSRFFTSPQGLISGSQGLISGSISVYTSQLYIIFIPLPTPFPFMGLLHLSWVFMYEISSPLSQARTQHLFSFPVWSISISFPPRVHKSSFVYELSYQIFNLATGSNFRTFIPVIHNDPLTSEPSDHTILVYLEFIAILVATTSSWYVPYPCKYSPLFQDYQKIVNTAFLKAEMQKILSLSDHEASELDNSNTESFDGLAFLPINSWPGDIQYLFHKSEIGDTDTFKLSSFHLETTCPFIYS